MKTKLKNRSPDTSHFSVAIVWQKEPGKGTIEITHGQLQSLRITSGKGRVSNNHFNVTSTGPTRLELTIHNAHLDRGAHSTMVTVQTQKNPFTFFLRDVTTECPIHIPDFKVAVIPSSDQRDYDTIAEAIRAKGLMSGLQQIESETEETYKNACLNNRIPQKCPTWLGLSRDMRIFRLCHKTEFGYWGYVEPCYLSVAQTLPGTENKPLRVGFCIGPGSSCQANVTRRLEDGSLPILHSTQQEDDVTYHLTAFATLETQPLTKKSLRGSQWEAVYPNTVGHMLKAEDREKIRDLLEAEMHGREEEVVCCLRVEAVNSGRVPRYAWFRGLHEGIDIIPAKTYPYQSETGFSTLDKDLVYGINRLDGQPLPQEEIAVLLQPGETTILEMLIPHQPISEARAKKLERLDVEKHLTACREFWRAKLASGANIHVPEPAINERIRAGLLHCDLVALGQEPNGTVLANIGWYGPIGSESAPIIQFFDSMGWHQLAERSIQYFLDRQREDGFIQNYSGYQLETGPTLWTIGEHYRYTRDNAWLRRIQPKLLKACDYLLKWRKRNQHADLRGKGYGLLDGKVADPEDFFHSFMLNGVSYLGIQRVSEILRDMNPSESRRLAQEAAAFRKDIRTAFSESTARSPVIPLGDGTWIPSTPPWTEYRGPLALYAEGGNWFTHGAFGCRDSLTGALYLTFSEILDANEVEADFLLKSHQQLFTVKNSGLSQPYYCRHDHAHLKRGEVKAFLKTYYNQLTALQDRETHTFWEHYFGGQHKTHEEGWFLMQTRWMLWLEENDTLRLLSGIPRAWLKDGQKIELNRVTSYFGPISLSVESQVDQNRIEAQVTCNTQRKPKDLVLRLPHPENRKAVKVEGGKYDPKTETVHVHAFKGQAKVMVHF